MEIKKNLEKKVSIIITTYNQEELLKKFLKSINQNTNYQNYRIYFVDDSGKGK